MDAIRNGNFNSSEIVALTNRGKQELGFGVPAMTFINECNMERRLGMALENEIDAKPLSWGKLCEPYAFDQLDLSYTLCSSITLQNPDIPYHVGSPDAKRVLDSIKRVADLKCPMTRKSFCQLVDPYIEKGKIVHEALTIEAVRANHKDGEKYFWQIVSNAILTGAKIGELIVFMPYLRELEAIKELASSAGESGEYTKWIYFANDQSLPHIKEGGHYKNINVIEFDILQRDVDFLTESVKLGGQLLTPFK